MKNTLILISIFFSSILTAQDFYFSFDNDTIKKGEILTGYYYKLNSFSEKKCFNRKTKFLFKLDNRYIVNAKIISENKCISRLQPMVRFLFYVDKIFDDKKLKNGIYYVNIIYHNTKPESLYNVKVANINLVIDDH
ncbi:hypothetical protein [Chryseobacterium indoltheticum]|uniref:hypothetical protein n=1 Tax=Chryseobacterium indoltheticum TaxID=254 RepID=UPI004042AF57